LQLEHGEAFQEKLSGNLTSAVAAAPPPPNTLSIIPLGGMGEIGKNHAVIQYDQTAVIIDCGVKFPNDVEQPGIDLIIPDFSYLLENKAIIKGLVLTHGHLDHIGSLPFLLRHINPPIYGSAYTLGLVRSILEEHKLLSKADLRIVHPGDRVTLGNMVIDFFHVCHSIPDGLGLAIHTPVGLVVHSGDFRFDATPVDGFKTDAEFLRRLGQEGVLVLLSDSTNTERSGDTPSERAVRPGLEQVFSEMRKGRIIATSFASNVHRFQQILEVAHQFKRKVATLGMSMTYNMNLAHELGCVEAPPDTWVSFDELKGLPPEKSVLVCTGSQGEPMSGLSLMASGQHSNVQVRPGDALVYCARVIPGNERTVNKMINDFYYRGAQVFAEGKYKVHVSGHGFAGDQRRLMELLRPRFFIPVHGEMRHQVSHKAIAAEAGLTSDRVFMMNNGDRWVFDGKQARLQGIVASGEVMVDGKGVGDIGDVVLRDRKHLSEDGMVLCVLGLTRKGEIVAGPDIISRGFVYERENEDVLEEARNRVRDAIAGMSAPDHSPGWDEVRAIVMQTLKRYFKQKFDRRPMILPVVMEL